MITSMKKAFALLLITAAMVQLLPFTAYAADPLTIMLSSTAAHPGDTLSVSGTASASTWVSLRGLAGDGSIVHFSAALSDGTGSYTIMLKVPVMTDGTLTIVASSDGVTASKTASVTTPNGGGSELGSSTGTLTAAVKVAFDAIAKASINGQTNGNYVIKAVEVPATALSDGARALVGGRPVYELSVTTGNTIITDFGGGRATVSIPYTPAPGEDSNAIVIFYITAAGEPTPVPTCVYDDDTGTVAFTTTHFSSFAVGYNNVHFSDISDTAWYRNDAGFLAARGVMRGSNSGVFNPEASITRAEVVTILSRISHEDLNGYTSSAFSDVQVSDWFFKGVQWAATTGVTMGSEGKFYPNAPITREQLATMLYRYADYTGVIFHADNISTQEFSDFGNIAGWAQDSVTWAWRHGIITGNPDSSFAPKTNATRAEAAKMIATLLRNLIIS